MAAVFTQLHQRCTRSCEFHHRSTAPTSPALSRLPASAHPFSTGKLRAKAGSGSRIPIRITTSILEDPSSLSRQRNGGSITKSSGWGTVRNSDRSLLTKMEAGQGVSDTPRSAQKVKETKVVIMVDPVEAKRLAAVEMKAIQARNKLKRQKEIEAINGGWAVLGLTAGIIIDGYTGKSILTQITGYLDAIADFLTRKTA